MHHMKRDWEKKCNLLHKKKPQQPCILLLSQTKSKHHFAKQSHWKVRGLLYLSTGSLISMESGSIWRYKHKSTKCLVAFSLYQSNGKVVFEPGGYYNPKFINKWINNPSKKPINSQQIDLTVSTTTQNLFEKVLYTLLALVIATNHWSFTNTSINTYLC